jgi:hypothetical protein
MYELLENYYLRSVCSTVDGGMEGSDLSLFG